MDEEYIICQYAKCSAYPGTNKKSWRYKAHGRDNCKFCHTPFRIPLPNAPPRMPTFKADKGKGAGSQAKSPKGREDWGKEELLDLLAEKCKDEEEHVQAIGTLKAAVCPPRTPKPQESLKQAMESMEKSSAEVAKLEKTVVDMDAAELKKARELMEYKVKVQSFREKLRDAKAAHAEAQHKFRTIQSEITVDDATAAGGEAACAAIPELSATDLSTELQKQDFMQGFDQQKSVELGTFLQTYLKDQLRKAVQKLLPDQAAAAAYRPTGKGPSLSTCWEVNSVIGDFPYAAYPAASGDAGGDWDHELHQINDDEEMLQSRSSVKRGNEDDELSRKNSRSRSPALGSGKGTGAPTRELDPQQAPQTQEDHYKVLAEAHAYANCVANKAVVEGGSTE